MTDSRKLTDNELEQVAGGFTPGESFSAGDYVEPNLSQIVNSKIVYRIDTINGCNATVTKYEKNSDGSVTTTGLSITIASGWKKLDPKPDWVD